MSSALSNSYGCGIAFLFDEICLPPLPTVCRYCNWECQLDEMSYGSSSPVVYRRQLEPMNRSQTLQLFLEVCFYVISFNRSNKIFIVITYILSNNVS